MPQLDAGAESLQAQLVGVEEITGTSDQPQKDSTMSFRAQEMESRRGLVIERTHMNVAEDGFGRREG